MVAPNRPEAERFKAIADVFDAECALILAEQRMVRAQQRALDLGIAKGKIADTRTLARDTAK